MMIQAVLGNPHHPEYGVATIPFPIPHDQYAHCMELLEALEIGDAVKADCQVQEINSFYSVLKRTEMLTVNVEDLNYLAKRLDSFDTGEAAQFQAMAHKLELFELKDLINLTFCCQQATVITDFSDLSAVGRDHYMNLHGGCAKTEELDALDSEATAQRLIESGSGTITPYGVVYDILLIQIAVGSLYMFSVPRGYTDGFIQWCKQIIGLCLTAFLQATILIAGLMVFKDHALLGLGLMLSAGEIPRIAGAFGLDTTTRANIMSAVYTAQAAVNTTRTIVQAVSK